MEETAAAVVVAVAAAAVRLAPAPGCSGPGAAERITAGLPPLIAIFNEAELANRHRIFLIATVRKAHAKNPSKLFCLAA